MKEIRLFEKGDWVWIGLYFHSEKIEKLVGPVKIVNVRGTTDKEQKQNIEGELFVYECAVGQKDGKDNILAYYNNMVVATREEAEEKIFTLRRQWELEDEKKLEIERKKLEDTVPKPVDKVD